MKGSRKRGLEAIREVLAKIPGSGLPEVDAQWSGFSKNPLPVVTVFGSYNTSKTSLLKRLLVESGAKVPEGLLVGGRRMTFSASELLSAFGLVFRDTPGISANDSVHELEAERALSLTDGVVVCLQPQLVTADHDAVIRLLSGQLYRQRGVVFPEQALNIVVTRIDAAGVDPEEDLGEFRALLTRKREELMALLKRDLPDLDLRRVAIHFVAADPYERVGNLNPVPAGIYDAYRAWDGIEDLVNSLRELPARFESLRAAAETRFYCVSASEVLKTLSAEEKRQELALTAAQNMVLRRQNVETQIAALEASARAELNAVVQAEVNQVTGGGHGTSGKFDKDKLAEKMASRLAEWDAKHTAELEKVMDEIGRELENSASQARAKTFASFFSDVPSSDEPKGKTKLEGKRLSSLSERVRQALQIHHEQKIGMKFPDVRKELKKLDKLGKPEERQKYFKSPQGFRDQKHADSAKSYLNNHEAVKALIPVMVELGALIWSEYSEAQTTKRAAERRKELSEQVRVRADQLAQAYWDGDSSKGLIGWKEKLGNIRGQLGQVFEVYEKTATGLEEALSNIKSWRSELESVLTQVETP